MAIDIDIGSGAKWDGLVNPNATSTVEASSLKTATGNGSAQTNSSARGVALFVNISAITGTSPTLVVKVQAKDPVSGNYVDLPSAETASLTATGTTLLLIYPGAAAIANSVVSSALPKDWRVAWTIGGTGPNITFSVGAQTIL